MKEEKRPEDSDTSDYQLLKRNKLDHSDIFCIGSIRLR